MRKFRFRAWDRYAKKMCDVYTIDFPTGHLFTDIGDSNLGAEVEALMQSTGLHDKNGVEIFEGDILRIFFPYEQYITHVRTDHTGTPFVVDTPSDSDYDATTLWWLYHSLGMDGVETEVIGNIYENLELLGGEK